MIDNPLPNQVMQEKEALYVNEQFEEHCANTAKEIAKDIEDLAEDLGLQIIADQLRENREDQERKEND